MNILKISLFNSTTKSMKIGIQQILMKPHTCLWNICLMFSFLHSPRENMMGIQHVATHIRTLVTLPSTSGDHAWQLHLLQFLGLHSFWTVKAKSSALPHVGQWSLNLFLQFLVAQTLISSSYILLLLE